MYFTASQKHFWSKLLGWITKEASSTPLHKVRIISFPETSQKPCHKAFPPLSKITHFPNVCPTFSHHLSHKARASSPLLIHSSHQSWTSKFSLHKAKNAEQYSIYGYITSLTLPKALHHKVYCMLLDSSFWGSIVLGIYKHSPHKRDEFMNNHYISVYMSLSK